MKFSEIFNKKVIDIETGENMGILTYLYMDKCECVVKGIGVANDEHMHIYSYENSLFGDVVLVDKTSILADETLCPIGIGQTLYDIKAFYLGEVEDFFIINSKVSSLIVNQNKISLNNILVFNKQNLITKKGLKIKTLKQNFSKIEEGVNLDNLSNLDTVKQNILLQDSTNNDKQILTENNNIFNEDNSAPNDIVADNLQNINGIVLEVLPLSSEKQIEEINPTEQQNLSEDKNKGVAYSETPILYSYKKETPIIINDYNFLVGKKLNRDVFDLTYTFFAKKGTMINSNIIAMAKKYGKIVDLALSVSNVNAV